MFIFVRCLLEMSWVFRTLLRTLLLGVELVAARPGQSLGCRRRWCRWSMASFDPLWALCPLTITTPTGRGVKLLRRTNPVDTCYRFSSGENDLVKVQNPGLCCKIRWILKPCFNSNCGVEEKHPLPRSWLHLSQKVTFLTEEFCILIKGFLLCQSLPIFFIECPE